MFFYGTLKRGGRNRDRYCGGALRVEEGAVHGELYDLPLLAIPRWSFRRYLFAPSARVTTKGMLKSRVAGGASV
jgi:hypothetical protein